VRDYLVAAGVPDARLRTISYGKERPLEICSDGSLLHAEPPRRDGSLGRRGGLIPCAVFAPLCLCVILAGPAIAQDRSQTLADIRQELSVLFVELQRLGRS
jgi:hypothetical protein